MDQTELREIEESGLRAWPCIESASVEGWIARFGMGYTRRANSAQSLGTVSDPDEAIRQVDDLYLGRGLRTIFRLTTISQPTDLDSRLESLGYELDCPAFVQVAAIGTCSVDSEVVLSGDHSERWLDVYEEANGLNNREGLLGVLDRLRPVRAFAALNGEACGLGVVDESRLWLFDIATLPAARRKKYARRIVQSLLAWGREQGATQACLQVTEANLSAQALYVAFGFETVLRYHYRILER